MSYFVLGIYGERIFTYAHSIFISLSPKTFSFICILLAYFSLRKISRTLDTSKSSQNKQEKFQMTLEQKNDTKKDFQNDI